MAQVLCLKSPGGDATQVEVDTSPFGEKVRTKLIRDAVLMYEANKRQGTHCTKTRGEIQATGRKPWKQKGTGRARAGDFASPLWRGGGVIFGPRPRDYSYSIPRRAKVEALRSALLGKLRDSEVRMIEDLGLDKPSTQSALRLLKKVDLRNDPKVDLSVGLVLPEADETAYKSFRNLRKVSVLLAQEITAYDVLRFRSIVFVGDALQRVTQRLEKGTAS